MNYSIRYPWPCKAVQRVREQLPRDASITSPPLPVPEVERSATELTGKNPVGESNPCPSIIEGRSTPPA
ncbi:MAG: hypothetical protein JW969_13230 [Spirochaetales bacterium]|nr:hypothetical protein [Spirochaetales bacterium]